MNYVALLRGINVGGNNKIPMAELKLCFEELGYKDVRTYIASGNVLFASDKNPEELTDEIQKILPRKFRLNSEQIKVLLLSHNQLQEVLDHAPRGFGAKPEKYHSDIIFLIDTPASEAIKIFNPRDGVDTIWRGDTVIYSQRLSAERTKSRLSAIMASPLYKNMTIRTYGTVQKLLSLLETR